MRLRALLLAALAFAPVARAEAQCVSAREELDCCSGFTEQPSYADPDPETPVHEACMERPANTVCYGGPDDYTWLLPVALPGWARAQCAAGQVEILFEEPSSLGFDGELHLHVVGSEQVKTLRPCAGEPALDPRACNAPVSLAQWQDGGLVYEAVEPLRFDAGTPGAGSGSGAPDVLDGGSSTMDTPEDPLGSDPLSEGTPKQGCSVRPGSAREPWSWLTATVLAVLVARGSRKRARRAASRGLRTGARER